MTYIHGKLQNFQIWCIYKPLEYIMFNLQINDKEERIASCWIYLIYYTLLYIGLPSQICTCDNNQFNTRVKFVLM